MSRRTLLIGAAALLLRRRPQRAVIFMCDGLGPDYLDASDMPTLARWRRAGLYKLVRGGMPAVTNTNNASICCGTWPATHGITGNSYFDERSGREAYMESSNLLLAPTLFERAAGRGVKSALLSSKKKTTTLLRRGADFVLTPELAPDEWVRRLGPAPAIYSREINYWLLQVAIDLLKTRRDLGCLYVHTTDYPMHTWAPDAPESREHLARLDGLFAEAEAAAPDAAFFLTADHGMHHKSRVWDLEKACAGRGLTLRAAISAERDAYLQHHGGFGGTSWVYLQRPSDEARAMKILSALPGVELVLSRTEAARRFHLMPSRIGQLAVFGDIDTVFGELDGEETRELPAAYRSHGSLHETDTPLVIHNAEGVPATGYFTHNHDLVRWLHG
ncbi:MAG: alkaline phosphatase family protein [Gemmatimonadales bacterium]